jgi:hypothetical protein
MRTTEARIETERPSRYLSQLCRHTNQMRRRHHSHDGGGAPPEVQHVEWSDTDGTIVLNLGRCFVQATSGTLTLRIEATSEEDLLRIQDLVTKRVEGFGRRDNLKVNWQTPTDEPGEANPAPAGTVARGRRLRGTIALVVLGAVALAVHLGLGGALMAGWEWTGWVANLVLALVLVKVVALVVIGWRRRHPS